MIKQKWISAIILGLFSYHFSFADVISFKDYGFFPEFKKNFGPIADFLLESEKEGVSFESIVQKYDLFTANMIAGIQRSDEKEDLAINVTHQLNLVSLPPPAWADLAASKDMEMARESIIKPLLIEDGKFVAPHSARDNIEIGVLSSNQVTPIKNAPGIYQVNRCITIRVNVARQIMRYLLTLVPREPHYLVPIVIAPSQEELKSEEEKIQKPIFVYTSHSERLYPMSFPTTQSDGTPDEDSLKFIRWLETANKRLMKLQKMPLVHEFAVKQYSKYIDKQTASLYSKCIKKMTKKLRKSS